MDELLRHGCSQLQAVAILRSKWTRWGNDNGRTALGQMKNDKRATKKEIDELVADTFYLYTSASE